MAAEKDLDAREHGPQPLDELMRRLELTSADLVEASTEQLTFKMVQKARKGRHLSPRIKQKVLNALHAVRPGERYAHRQLFNYP